MELYIIPFLLLPFLLAKKSSSGSSGTLGPSVDTSDVAEIAGVPFAEGGSNPLWPVVTNNVSRAKISYKKKNGKYEGNPARSFGFIRESGERLHVGMDLYCNNQDPVICMEDGIVVDTQGFLGPTKAILIQHNDGLVVLYGEVTDGSWGSLKTGSKVSRGQQIATIGKNNAGTSMLHLETYRKGTTKNYSWTQGTKPNDKILNPTKYILKASENLK